MRVCTAIRQHFGGSPDATIAKSVASYPSGSRNAFFTVHHASRAVSVDSMQSLVASVGYVTPVSSPDRPGSSPWLKEEQWIKITQLPHSCLDSNSNQSSTLVRCQLTLSSASATDADWMGDITKTVVIPMWNEAISRASRMLENALVARACD